MPLTPQDIHTLVTLCLRIMLLVSFLSIQEFYIHICSWMCIDILKTCLTERGPPSQLWYSVFEHLKMIFDGILNAVSKTMPINVSEENEERSMLAPGARNDQRLVELIKVLIEWLNDELADQRIIVKDIEEDLFDGQVLQKLLGEFLADIEAICGVL